MRMPIKTIVLVTLFAAPAMAETIAQAQRHKTWQDQVDGQVMFANNACGTAITAPVDWAGFDAVDLDHASASGTSVSVGQYCGEALEALTYLCHATPTAKAAIKRNVSKVVCRYGGPGHRAVSLSGGTLGYSVDFKLGGTGKMYVQAYVANHI